MRDQVSALARLPIEAAAAAILGVAVLYTDGAWRTAALVSAILLTLLLPRTYTGIRLFAAIVTTALFATAVFWEDVGGWRLAFVGAGVVAIWIARWLGAIVWPDVAIFFLAGLAVVAVRDAREEPVRPEQPPSAVAVFDLPKNRIRAPASELPAPSKIEVLALTRAGLGRRASTNAERVNALLLTPVKRSGATEPVRVVIERGKDSSAAKELARATLNATEFVLLPAGECFVASRRTGLSHERAMAILEGHGFSEAVAEDYVDSFVGPVDFVPAVHGARFNRYFSGRNKIGRFLTHAEFSTSGAARDGLELPEQNRATTRQTVSVVAPSMTLRGRVKGGLERARQFLVLRTTCFDYGPGRPVEAPAP